MKNKKENMTKLQEIVAKKEDELCRPALITSGRKFSRSPRAKQSLFSTAKNDEGPPTHRVNKSDVPCFPFRPEICKNTKKLLEKRDKTILLSDSVERKRDITPTRVQPTKAIKGSNKLLVKKFRVEFDAASDAKEDIG